MNPDPPELEASKEHLEEYVLARAGNSTSTLYALDVEALVDMLFDIEVISLERIERALQKQKHKKEVL